MNVLRMRDINRPILDLLILLLEEPHEPWSIMSTIALRPKTNLVVIRLVGRKLKEPSLRKVPQRMRRLRGAIRRARGLLAGNRAHPRRGVHLRHVGPVVLEVGHAGHKLVARGVEGDCDVCEDVVGEADLVWLVNVEHVDLVVPAPGIEGCGGGVWVDEAGSVFLEEAHHGGGAGAAVEPDGKGSILGVFPCFKEPEEAGLQNVSGFQATGGGGSLTYVLTG